MAVREAKKQNVHNTTQNQMLKLMALNILWDIAKNIRDGDFFSPMCDEATYVAYTSQLVVCIQWVDDNLNANYEFIGLKEFSCTHANSIVFLLKEVLQRMHFLKIQQCRGQCYEGCSKCLVPEMALQWKSKKKVRALYTFCYAHSLNLDLGDTMNACPV